MKTFSIVTTALAVLAAVAPLSSASADSAEAMCEVRKHGDTRRGASGPCTFSQRQGYVDIDLRNGDSYSLAPGSKSGHYKDQRGNKVFRTSAGNSEEFKWEGGKKILVTWNTRASAHHSASSNYRAGDTSSDLADLVGAKAGQAEGELQRRGYRYTTGSTSGNAKYSSWYNSSTGRCVMIRTEEGRYQSIVQTSPVDCGRSGSSVGSGSRGATSAAESACMSAVNRNYGGRVRNLTVVRSEFSQANSEVIINADGERWRCLSSNDGVVADLSIQ